MLLLRWLVLLFIPVQYAATCISTVLQLTSFNNVVDAHLIFCSKQSAANFHQTAAEMLKY